MPTEKTVKPSAASKSNPIVLELPVFGESSSYTGEQVKVPRLEVPLIRVSYKDEGDESRVAPKGEFVEYHPVSKNVYALGKKITIQILHHRQSLSAYKQLSGTASESYYTPEISMKAKSAPLFLAKADGSGKRTNEFLMDGEIKKDGPLRKTFPELRYQRSVYVLHEGKLKNLVIYGASFSGFIEFTKAIQGQSSASCMIELTTKKEKTGTVVYYPIVFTPKEKVNMKLIEPTLKQLSDWFDEFDRRVAANQAERKEQAQIARGDGPSDVKPSELRVIPSESSIREQIKHDEEGDRETLEAEASKMFD